jgi:hypothetical protein
MFEALKSSLSHIDADIKVEYELIDLKLLGVHMQSIPKQLHETVLVIEHCTTALSQGVELIELALNEFLRQIPLPKLLLE